jgi:hypothetical protein
VRLHDNAHYYGGDVDYLKERVDELFGFIGDIVPVRGRVVILASLDRLKESGVVFVVKRGESAEQDIHDHPNTPHIDRVVVLLPAEDLWCDIAGSPACCCHRCVGS